MNLIARFLMPPRNLRAEISGDVSLKPYGYLSNQATAVTEIDLGGEGQVLYEGVYWTVRYLEGHKKIGLGQTVYVKGRELATKLIISEMRA